MTIRLLALVLALTACAASDTAAGAARVGDPAPAFTATDSKGVTHDLSAYKGKLVVLEWHNRECPYTQKHYESGSMQKLQKEWTAKGVVWLTVISSAPGEQGYVTAAEQNAHLEKVKAAPTAALLDPKGEVGRLYGARTTPHMFIIDGTGALIYNGAIDDRPTTDAADVQGATNYVATALQQATAGKPVATATTQPYGCNVKYARGTH
jgi:peroxiredoxin